MIHDIVMDLHPSMAPFSGVFSNVDSNTTHILAADAGVLPTYIAQYMAAMAMDHVTRLQDIADEFDYAENKQ